MAEDKDADETGRDTPGSAVDLDTRLEAFRDWLMDQPRDVVVPIAARAALRVVPLLGARLDQGQTSKHLKRVVAPGLRAVNAAWLMGANPTDAAAADAAANAADAAYAAVAA
ncbi:MAG: hypothetical protein ACFB2Z_00425, partial [Maricaulaceae bacterium]